MVALTRTLDQRLKPCFFFKKDVSKTKSTKKNCRHSADFAARTRRYCYRNKGAHRARGSNVLVDQPTIVVRVAHGYYVYDAQAVLTADHSADRGG